MYYNYVVYSPHIATREHVSVLYIIIKTHDMNHSDIQNWIDQFTQIVIVIGSVSKLE